jgi:hypothetical protein
VNLSMTGSLADRFKSGSQKAGNVTVPLRITRLRNASPRRVALKRIPTGFHHPAQGCEARATLGQPSQTISNPDGVASPFAPICSTLSGLWPFPFITRRSRSLVAATLG